MQMALKINDLELVAKTFVDCKDRTDRRQLAFMLSYRRVRACCGAIDLCTRAAPFHSKYLMGPAAASSRGIATSLGASPVCGSEM